MKVIANIRVGKPDVDPETPSHVKGVRSGNAGGKQPGIVTAGDGARGNARRSTGINAKHRDPIDPRMPKLSPA
jgi:hypothetical protein